MRKTDKKTERNVVAALKNVCETALGNIAGFEWLTHFVDYKRFPDSLSVVCVFSSRDALDRAHTSNKTGYLLDLIKQELLASNINIRSINHHVKFDTEEDCLEKNAGNWKHRFSGK